MAIFDKEKEFYSRPASPVKSDRSLVSQFVEFFTRHVFVLTLPISIIAFAVAPQFKSTNWVVDLITITLLYGGIIGVPALVAALVAIPALLAWRTHKHHAFMRVFETAFVFLYLLWALMLIASPKPATLPR